MTTIIPEGYEAFLRDLKSRIRATQIKAALSVNREMIVLYLDIGFAILERQQIEGWGKSVVEQLAHDLRIAFPDLRGFSPRNLWDMRRLAQTCKGDAILRQLVAEIPWGHNLVLVNKVKDLVKRRWYITQTIENGWPRNVLVHQIETDLYARQVEAPKTTNFSETLPPLQSDLARQVLKDPYVFDFLSLGQEAYERELEGGLIDRISEASRRQLTPVSITPNLIRAPTSHSGPVREGRRPGAFSRRATSTQSLV